jgi:hypothetical protein
MFIIALCIHVSIINSYRIYSADILQTLPLIHMLLSIVMVHRVHYVSCNW